MLVTSPNKSTRIKSESGLVALEFLAVVGAWLLALAFLLNICLVLGNGVVMQAVVNRAALQATAKGCVSAPSAANIDSLTHMLADNIVLSAVWVQRQDGGGFDRAAALARIDPGGDTSGLCFEDFDTVPEGDYILLDLEYQQGLLLFPSISVRKTALAVSSSLNLENRDGQETP